MALVQTEVRVKWNASSVYSPCKVYNYYFWLSVFYSSFVTPSSIVYYYIGIVLALEVPPPAT